MTNKQNILIAHCKANGSIKTSEANELLKSFYYCNHAHYVSEILSRMVKSGVFVRKKIGVYELRKISPVEQNQLF
jgi:hypothetical protein